MWGKIARKGGKRAFSLSLSLVSRSTKGLFTGYFVLISVRPFSCQRQTALNTDLHSMQITAEKLTRCDDREVKFELIILFQPGTIEFSSSAVDV